MSRFYAFPQDACQETVSDTQQEDDAQRDSDFDVDQEEDTQVPWISCIGQLKFSCEHISICEGIVKKASITYAPQPNVLLEEFIIATEKGKSNFILSTDRCKEQP